jgi:two-component system, cell cycle sensor histidine kinase and response regulator CckA
MTDQQENSISEIVRLKMEVQAERLARLQAEEAANQTRRELFNQQRRLELLQTIAMAANQATTIEQALQIALDRISAHMNWPLGHVYLQAQDGTTDFVPLDVWHCDDPERFAEFRRVTQETRKPAGVGLPGRVFMTGRAVCLPDLSVEDNLPRAKMLLELGLKSAYGFPLLIGPGVVGVMVFFSGAEHAPDEALLKVITHLGAQLGRVIERQQAQEGLQRREIYFRRLTDSSLDLITILGPNGLISYESASIEQTLGYKPEEYNGRNAFEFVHPEDLPRVSQAFMEALQQKGNTPMLNFRFRHKDGSYRTLEGVGNNLLADPAVNAIVFNSRDITERRRLEQQFLQAQKVQAIGQLAAGVAHDFNNILTAILGYSDMLLMQMKPADTQQGPVTGIKQAAMRAAALTRQLLAFGRKQMLNPVVLSLNTSIAEMDKMLRRLLGADITMATIPHSELGNVKADAGQIEQVILNLSVNARDAMPRGGKLTIETGNVTLDEDYARLRPEVKAGDYVMLAVSDNGTGMPPEVQARLFEPFFTTKDAGKGTGLGLATCHGIVKQSGGHIAVYSELGQGTTFKVYLPRVGAPVETTSQSGPDIELPRGLETVLLVDDEPMVRELGASFLGRLGYTVLVANNGRQAMNLVHASSNKQIDLLLTDVVMPEMGGRDLADFMRSVSPKTRVLFCSGYTEDVASLRGATGSLVTFLPKPFTVAALAKKVREVLDH